MRLTGLGGLQLMKIRELKALCKAHNVNPWIEVCTTLQVLVTCIPGHKLSQPAQISYYLALDLSERILHGLSGTADKMFSIDVPS